jgi:hypothetical protein
MNFGFRGLSFMFMLTFKACLSTSVTQKGEIFDMLHAIVILHLKCNTIGNTSYRSEEYI